MATDSVATAPKVFQLPLTGRRNHRQGVVIGYALVPDDDFTRTELTRYRWHNNGIGYAYRTSRKHEGAKRHTILLHVVVFEHYHGATPDGLVIDHIDRNPLNNLPNNLRAVTQNVNMANGSRHSSNKSGFRGVHWCNRAGKWIAKIRIHGKRTHLGSFATAREAADKVNEAYQNHYPGVQIPNPHG